ncbi:M23 family metallopeptidase [Hoeflea sp. YIM 152468]|uniref:M23 family metallopeptidase n=1 Tax=Hoeflea sp. YIM 152468 TaxID=3031759 RepID=UPI0023DCB4AA|nr:M23 family metallopeptidase [Hoeflea sp. YIM 152468]MDF1607488.1 M23 family metallopeptidase [Hoeflea sp. YIM 152468]
MSQRQDSRVFGKKPKHSHTIILASGESIRHVTIRPWIAGLLMSFLGVMAIGYLGATSYLVLRDDLIGASMARQARMQHAYEDRIAALRSQVDRVTSRQLLDQQLMEEKVAELIARQNALTNRQGKLGPLLDRAGAAPGPIPVPTENPKKHAALATAAAKTQRLAALATRATILTDPAQAHMNPLAFTSGIGAVERESVGERADRIFSSVTLSLKSIEREQIEKMQALAIDAFETASEIDEIIKTTGLPMPAFDDTAVGGPFVRPNDPNAFDATMDDLDQALGRLDAVRRHASKLPVGYPAPGREITSRFGNRRDPFVGRLAFHSGIDFRAPTGTPIFSTGTGIVIHAGRNGGYGKMIEIDHGNGLTTRYAHLSAIEVREGDHVIMGARIGKSGSTGRSTGPHLHYEVRRNGTPIDAMRFLKAAKKLKTLLVANR